MGWSVTSCALKEAFEVYPGDPEEDIVTPPTGPASSGDDNQHVAFVRGGRRRR